MAKKKKRKPDLTILSQKIRELGFAKYRDYLHSVHWRRFRERYRTRLHPPECVACGGAWSQLHHVRYDNLGCERLRDVVPVCKTCHEQIHAVHRATGLPLCEIVVAVERGMSVPASTVRSRLVRLFGEAEKKKSAGPPAVRTGPQKKRDTPRTIDDQMEELRLNRKGKKRMLAMLRNGRTVEAIAEAFGVTRPAMGCFLRDYLRIDLSRPLPPEPEPPKKVTRKKKKKKKQTDAACHPVAPVAPRPPRRDHHPVRAAVGLGERIAARRKPGG